MAEKQQCAKAAAHSGTDGRRRLRSWLPSADALLAMPLLLCVDGGEDNANDRGCPGGEGVRAKAPPLPAKGRMKSRTQAEI